MKTKLLPLVLTLATILSGTGRAFEPIVDRFDEPELDGFRWYEFNPTKGQLLLEGGKLNYVVRGAPTADDFASLELRSVYPSKFENWEMTLKISNTERIRKHAGCGFMIFNTQNRSEYLYMNFYSSYGVSSGVFSKLSFTPAPQFSMEGVAPIGAVRVSHDSATQLMTISAYRKKITGEYRWIVMGTFSPYGAPGGDISAKWLANATNRGNEFGIQLFGASESSWVASGKVTIDDFRLRPLP